MQTTNLFQDALVDEHALKIARMKANLEFAQKIAADFTRVFDCIVETKRWHEDEVKICLKGNSREFTIGVTPENILVRIYFDKDIAKKLTKVTNWEIRDELDKDIPYETQMLIEYTTLFNYIKDTYENTTLYYPASLLSENIDLGLLFPVDKPEIVKNNCKFLIDYARALGFQTRLSAI